MKKKTHKSIKTIHIGKPSTMGTVCHIENKTYSYNSTDTWRKVDCKLCLILKKKIKGL